MLMFNYLNNILVFRNEMFVDQQKGVNENLKKLLN